MAVEQLPLASTGTYRVEFCHSHSEGLAASPVAGPGPQNASIVRLHAPFELLTIYWCCCSEGKPPILPSSKSFINNGNRLFLGGERCGVVTPALVGHLWYAAGKMDFLVVAPEGLDSNFTLSKCPWEGTPGDNAIDFYIPLQNFQMGIINPGGANPTGVAPDPDVPLLDLQLQTGIQG